MSQDPARDRRERFQRAERNAAQIDLEVPVEGAFTDELDGIMMRVTAVQSDGRERFQDGSASYDRASMAIIRLAAMFEASNLRFAPFLDSVSEAERNGIKATRQYAGHAGYRQMTDDIFWQTITEDVPALLRRIDPRS